MEISAKKLTQIYTDLGVSPDVVWLFDSYFALPTENWVMNKLGPALENFLKRNWIQYRMEQFECNKFAKTASMLADWSWFKTKEVDSALAFGVFGFLRADGAGHMINTCVHKDDNGKLYAAFYEPQFSGPVTIIGGGKCLKPIILTSGELSSCCACVFV